MQLCYLISETCQYRLRSHVSTSTVKPTIEITTNQKKKEIKKKKAKSPKRNEGVDFAYVSCRARLLEYKSNAATICTSVCLTLPISLSLCGPLNLTRQPVPLMLALSVCLRINNNKCGKRPWPQKKKRRRINVAGRRSRVWSRLAWACHQWFWHRHRRRRRRRRVLLACLPLNPASLHLQLLEVPTLHTSNLCSSSVVLATVRYKAADTFYYSVCTAWLAYILQKVRVYLGRRF